MENNSVRVTRQTDSVCGLRFWRYTPLLFLLRYPLCHLRHRLFGCHSDIAPIFSMLVGGSMHDESLSSLRASARIATASAVFPAALSPRSAAMRTATVRSWLTSATRHHCWRLLPVVWIPGLRLRTGRSVPEHSASWHAVCRHQCSEWSSDFRVRFSVDPG